MSGFKTSVVLGLAVLATALLSGDAEARQARWQGRLWGKIDAKILERVEQKGPKAKKVALMKEKFVFENSELDTTSTLHLDLFAPRPPEGVFVRMPGEFPDESDKKSKIAPGEDDAAALENVIAGLLADESIVLLGKPKLEALSTAVTEVDAKGKIVVKANFQKVKFQTKYKFTGFIDDDSSEYFGHPVAGTVWVKFKGDRDDDDE